MNRKILTSIALILSATISLSACGANNFSSETSTQGETFSSKGCISIPDSLGQAIAAGLHDDATATGKFAGFPSSDYADIKMVAVELAISGISSKQVAVFATQGSSNDGGIVVSVDSMAETYSDWGHPRKLDLSIASSGAQDAKDCLELLDSGH